MRTSSGKRVPPFRLPKSVEALKRITNYFTDVKLFGILGWMSAKLLTTEEAADAIGVSRATLQAWIKDGNIQPPAPTLEGAVAKRLWGKADIEKARKFKGTLKPGPKSKKKAK